MIHLELDRTCPGGLGFSLVTAEKDHQTGVFVRSIRPNSQAAQDGRLRVMDRIVQVYTKIYRYPVYTKIYRYIHSCMGIVEPYRYRRMWIQEWYDYNAGIIDKENLWLLLVCVQLQFLFDR